MPTASRRAYTLIELLVVIAVVGVMVALVIAAVVQVREAAAKTQCQGNLRQIGIACHQYHGTFGVLPPGGTVVGDPSAKLFLTWHTRLLPFIEQDAVWRQAHLAYGVSEAFWAVPHQLGTVIPLYGCPSDPRTLTAHWMPAKGGIMVSLTAYLGVQGTNCLTHDGLLYSGSKVRFADVTDGLSQTLAVGERPPRADFQFGWWYNGHGLNVNGSAGSLLGVRELNQGALENTDCSVGPHVYQRGRLDEFCDIYHFWSLHRGGANFLFADGSVRFLSYAADSIMPALAGRNDGQPVSFLD